MYLGKPINMGSKVLFMDNKKFERLVNCDIVYSILGILDFLRL